VGGLVWATLQGCSHGDSRKGHLRPAVGHSEGAIFHEARRTCSSTDIRNFVTKSHSVDARGVVFCQCEVGDSSGLPGRVSRMPAGGRMAVVDWSWCWRPPPPPWPWLV
jgi:hypothetical protein